jgi:hypothetical protein
MPTEKNPSASPAQETQPTDDTVVLPLEDSTPSADDTTVLPLEEDTPSADETAVPPVAEDTSSADDTALLPLGVDTPSENNTSVLPVAEDTTSPDDTAVLPGGTAEPEVAAVPAPPTSPIGTLYAPADRPEPVRRTSAYGDGAPAEPFGASDAAPDRVDPVVVAPAELPRRRLRVGTVVWGLVIAAIGVGLLAWAAGVAIDLQLAMIVLLAVAGTALLVGSILSGARNARR